MLHLIPRAHSKAIYEPIERYQSEADLLHDIAPAHRHAKAFYDFGDCNLMAPPGGELCDKQKRTAY